MTDPVLSLSAKAKRRVLEIRASEDGGGDLALWVEVIGATGGDYTYDLYFDAPEVAGPDDAVHRDEDGLVVVVPGHSADLLRGAQLDMSRDLLNPGLVIVNPNKPPQEAPPSSPPVDHRALELSGTVSERVQQVLDQAVNPSIAAHGGEATLVAVEDDTVYLRLNGGCAGCGQATVTLSQGIEVAIREAVPEIVNIVDVTDHAAGTNPYYEPAAT